MPVRDLPNPVISQPCLYLLHGYRTAASFTSSLSGLPDQVLLAHTRSLVLHEQALQLAVLDHLREIQARHLHLRLGCSSLFDYAVRELGYSEGAAWRRIKAMRLCAETAGTRERLQDGSLTLSAAAQLQNTFDLQQRAATAAAHPASVSAAPAAPELLPGGTGTAPEAGALGPRQRRPRDRGQRDRRRCRRWTRRSGRSWWRRRAARAPAR